MAFSFDDAWDNGPEVTRAGTAAFGLYCRCGAWVARNLTDGFVPSELAAAYGTPEWARKLVDVGLWEIAEGGYRMPHYLDRNPSRDKVLARRQADAERKAKWRERQHEKGGMSREESNGSHGVTPQGFRATSSPPKGGKGAPASRGGARPSTTQPPGVDRTVSEVLSAPECEHGAPRAVSCALCRRKTQAEKAS